MRGWFIARKRKIKEKFLYNQRVYSAIGHLEKVTINYKQICNSDVFDLIFFLQEKKKSDLTVVTQKKK